MHLKIYQPQGKFTLWQLVAILLKKAKFAKTAKEKLLSNNKQDIRSLLSELKAARKRRKSSNSSF